MNNQIDILISRISIIIMMIMIIGGLSVLFLLTQEIIPFVTVTAEENEFCESLGFDRAIKTSKENTIQCLKSTESTNRFGRTITENISQTCFIEYNPADINHSHYGQPRCYGND